MNTGDHVFDRISPVGGAVVIAISLMSLVFTAPEASGQSAKSSLKDPEQAAMFNRISDRLVCQCGCNMILRVCNHHECPSAVPMRKKIEEQIVAGESEEEIVAGFAAEYGQVVLSSPPPRGINLAAWVMPGFAVLIGLFFLFYVVADWLARKKVKSAAANVTLDPAIASRIEDELRGLER